jgi:hypothetical protein
MCIQETKPTPAALPAFLRPRSSQTAIYFGLAFVLTIMAPGIWFFWILWGAPGLGFFSLFTCWAIAGGLFLYAIISLCSKGSRQTEEQYQCQMLSQAEQYGFSQEFVQNELRAISRQNTLRQVVLILIIAILLFILATAVSVVASNVMKRGGWHGGNFNNRVVPTGQVITEEREIDGDFTILNISSAIHVEFKLSDRNVVVVETHEEVMPFIRTMVKSDSLTINQISNRYRDLKKLHVTVYYHNFPRTIFVSGASNLTCTEFIKTESLSLDASGVSNVSFKNLEIEKLSIRVNGVSNAYITGKAETVTAWVDGVSNLHASAFEAEYCDIDVKGSSNVYFGHIHEELSIHAAGASHLTYRGTPTIKRQEILGASRVSTR